MPGLLRGVARTAVVAGTATAVSNNVSRRQAQRWSQDGQPTQAYMQTGQQTEQYAPQPNQQPVDPTVAQLQQLGELVNQGLLTQEEFEAKKKQVLGI